MKVDMGNFGELMMEFKRLPWDAKMKVKVGSEVFSEGADLSVEGDTLVLAFPAKAVEKKAKKK